MSDQIRHIEFRGGAGQTPQPLPCPHLVGPEYPCSIRVASQTDFDWIDARQKAESDKLGFLPAVAIQKRIDQGNVLVAEVPPAGLLGYCIAVDRYMKQDHVGQFVQLKDRKSVV